MFCELVVFLCVLLLDGVAVVFYGTLDAIAVRYPLAQDVSRLEINIYSAVKLPYGRSMIGFPRNKRLLLLCVRKNTRY